MSGNSSPGFWETIVQKATVHSFFGRLNRTEPRNALSCETTKMAYMCEAHATEASKPEITSAKESCDTFFSGAKPTEVFAYNGNCYLFSSELSLSPRKCKFQTIF